MRKYLLFLFLLLLPSTAGATNFFVTTSGSDSHGCTNNSSDACLTISHGVSVAHGAGNTLSVGSGTYTENITVSSGGSAGNNFIIQGFAIAGSCPQTASSDPYTPEGTHPVPTAKVIGTFTLSASNVTLLCFEITPNNSGTDGGTTFSGPIGISASGSGFDIEDNYLHKNGPLGSFGGGNVFTDAINCGGCSTTTIKHNYMVRAAANQMWIGGGTGNTFLDNEEFKGESHTSVTTFDIDYNQVGGINNSYIHNYMHGMDYADCDGGLTYCHIDCFEKNGNFNGAFHDDLFDGNVCFNENQGLFWNDVSSSTYNSYGEIFNDTAINNIIAFGPGAGTSFWSCTEIIHAQVRFDNNVCWGTGASFLHGSQITSFENNIMYQTYKTFSSLCTIPYGSDIHNEGGTASTFLVNQKNILYEDTTCSVGTSGPNVSYSSDLRNTNPLWTAPGTYPQTGSYGNLYLASSSPALAAGINLFAIFTDYKDGTTRANSAFDIGPLPVTGGGGTAPVATFSCNPGGLDFGTVNVGASSSPQTCTLTNTGNATLSVTANGLTTGTQYSFNSTCGAVTFNLTASSSCNYNVTFTPTSAGTKTDTFSITDNATGSPHTFAITGIGNSTSAIADSVSTPCGATITLSTTPTNCTFSTPGPGYLLDLVVQFHPGTGNHTAVLTAVDDNTLNAWTIVPGANAIDTSAGADDAIGQWYVSSNLGGETTLTLTANQTAIATVVLHRVSNVNNVDQVCVANTQSTAVTANGCSVTTTVANEFISSAGWYNGCLTGTIGAPFVMGYEQSAGLYMDAIVSSTGTYHTAWSVSCATTFDSSTVSFAQTSPTPPNPQFNPTGLSFPNTFTGNTSSALTTVLTNTGGTAMTITSITKTGTDFVNLTSNCPISPSTLAASAFCNISIQFAPATTGAKTGNISVADNAPGSPQSVPLAGTGLAAPASTDIVSSSGGVPIP